MPSAIPADHGVPGVGAAAAFLDELLNDAESIKKTSSIEPPLKKTDFEDLPGRLSRTLGWDLSNEDATKKTQRYAIIETAVRDTFKSLIATTPIEAPEFVRVWNLLDILSFLSDSELCDPALLFWIVEELLDSQTIAGCRKVFDFLESRRERITAKHLKQKQLVILRTCNELLRRLSRALDPAFCGRVFIFMFQTFPLGDKSSVNLRGEYHLENVTTWDRDIPAQDGDKMDVDSEAKPQLDVKALDPDALYPIFWALQESFNQPKRLFEPSNLAAFKAGLEATMATFKSIKPEQPSRARERPEKPPEEIKHSLKKKRDDLDEELASGFNPKYLTSRDLFKLEISDLAFRRNILVQALIIMEFLLSLSPKAKEKLTSVKQPNKSVMYLDYQLSEEDTKWVLDMKERIVDYLKQGPEGPYFNRMVETVLSRDKNWVRWKIENCPPIELPPLSPVIFDEARSTISKLATTKRPRSAPLGSLSLDFLNDDEEDDDSGARAMQKLKDPTRYRLPELSTLKRGIEEDDLEIDMPMSEESKARAIEGKASKTWRALRIAAKSKLAVFDRIDDDEKIDIVFQEMSIQQQDGADREEMEDGSNGEAIWPDDRRAIIIVDTTGGESDVVKNFLAKHCKVFVRVVQHTTRKPREGEINGKDFHFVDKQTFGMMRDGDQFLEYSEPEEGQEGECRGTSKKLVDSIMDNDRVPVMELNQAGAQQVKDNGFDARFILVKDPLQDAENGELFETVVENKLEALEAAIFGSTNTAVDATAAGLGDGDGDVTMADGIEA